MEYTVYLRTNLINGKQYVGQTGDFTRRNYEWNTLTQKYANEVLQEDRKKYRLENFKTDILAECETQEEAWELEQRYIAELGTKYPAGYNMSDGGESKKGCIVTEEMKKQISETLIKYFLNEDNKKHLSDKHKGMHNSPATEFKKGHEPWIKGKKHKKESIEKMRKSHKCSKPWNKGKKGYMSEETKEKIINNLKKHNSIPIIQIKEDGTIIEWCSAIECANKCPEYSSRSISEAKDGKYSIKKGHKYKDSIWYRKEDYEALKKG